MSETKTIPTWADVKAACDKDEKHVRESMPANLVNGEYPNGLPMSAEPHWDIPMAMLDYLKNNEHLCGDNLSKLIELFPEPTPEFETDDEAAGYIVFPDGSLYFWNNAEDEVWYDYKDYIIETLNYTENWDDFYDMDKALLIFYHGDEESAKNAIEN